jgi:addiction module HigA family antidote
MSAKYKFEPDYAVHPGETLKEKLEELEMSPKEFSIRTGKPVKTISEIINCKSSITPDMAVQFEKVLGISAGFWIRKQANYNEFAAREKQKQILEEAKKWARKFPYPKMAQFGWVTETRKHEEKAEELLSFFNISKASSWENIYLNQKLPLFLRISLKHAKDPYALSATNPDNFFSEIKSTCIKAGVKVIYTPLLPKTVINGAVRWLGGNPIIQVSDRYKRYDIFWFSLFHEIGHIILHGNKKNIFIEDTKNIDKEDIQEKEANDFAAKWLLTDEEYDEIIEQLNNGKDIEETINLFANKFETHRDIIIGRLLFNNKDLYRFGFLQNLITKIDFQEQNELIQ